MSIAYSLREVVRQNGRPAPEVASANKQSAFNDESVGLDYSNDRVLIGDSQNVFVGKVVSNLGTKPADPADKDSVASTLYAAQVILNIKGNLHGSVTIKQFEFGKPQLQVGSTYIFAARYWSDDNSYAIIYHPYQYELLAADPNLGISELQELAAKSDRVRALEAAYPKEIITAFDIRYHGDLNSYAKRHYDAQGNLIDDTVELAKQHVAASNEPAQPSTPAANTPATESVSPSATPDQAPADTAVSPSEIPVPTDTPAATPAQ